MVCVGQGKKPEDRFSHNEAHLNLCQSLDRLPSLNSMNAVFFLQFSLAITDEDSLSEIVDDGCPYKSF